MEPGPLDSATCILWAPNRGEGGTGEGQIKAKVLNFNLQVLSGKGWFSQGKEGKRNTLPVKQQVRLDLLEGPNHLAT